MLPKLLFLFIIIPLIEISLLLKMGQHIGIWETIGVQILSGFIGATLAKRQGLKVWKQIDEDLKAGRIPTDKLLDGLLIFAAGLVLLTPGILTDCFGLTLLFPGTRIFYKKWLKSKFNHMVQKNSTGIYTLFSIRGSEPQTSARDDEPQISVRDDKPHK